MREEEYMEEEGKYKAQMDADAAEAEEQFIQEGSAEVDAQVKLAYDEIPRLMQHYISTKASADQLAASLEDTKKKLNEKMRFVGINTFEDQRGNTAQLKSQTRETLDKKKVRELIGELQYEQVVKVTTFDVLTVLSKTSRDKIKKVLNERRTKTVEKNQ